MGNRHPPGKHIPQTIGHFRIETSNRVEKPSRSTWFWFFFTNQLATQMSHLLSVESWLFNRDRYHGLS